jgi:hypothetical protein
MLPTGNERPGKCPICKAPSVNEYRPFCSRRCADVDLARWLRGAYVIPEGTRESEEASGEAIAANGDADNSTGPQ